MMQPNVATLRFSDTTPAGRPLLSISVARHLDQIEKFSGIRPTVSACVMSIAMHPASAVIDPAPSNRLDGGIQLVGEIASQFFKDGTENADYILTYLFTFSNGSKEPFDAMISVRKFIGL
jgi:hypothetical protein